MAKKRASEEEKSAAPTVNVGRAITLVMGRINDKFGVGAIKRASEMEKRTRTSTGFPSVDPVLLGGFPNGTFTVIWGPEKSGKSSFTYQVLGNILAENDDVVVIVVDIENAFDRVWAETLGLLAPGNADRVLVIPADADIMDAEPYIEQFMNRIMETIREFKQAGVKIGAVLMDSMHGMAAQQEVVKKSDAKKGGELRDMKDDTVAALARRMAQFMRCTTAMVSRMNAPFIIIGQTREAVDSYGGGETLSGGRAVKHFSRCTLRLTRVNAKDQQIVRDKKIVGWPVKILVQKIMGETEGDSTEIFFYKGTGFNDLRSNVLRAIAAGAILETSKSHYEWATISGEILKLHGKNAVLDYFEANEAEYQVLLTSIAKYANNVLGEATTEDEDANTTDT